MKISVKYLVVLSIVIGSFSFAKAQNQTASESINSLKNGVLVVRLDMQKNKIEAYEKSMSSSTISEDNKLKTEGDYKKLIKERETYKQSVIDAFSTTYNFSQIVFIENQHFKDFLNGNHEKIEGDQNAKEKLKSSNDVFFLIKGRNDGQWIIVDKEFKRPSSPFPSSFGFSGFKNFFDFLIGSDAHSLSNQTKLAQKANDKLLRYMSKI